MKFKKEEDLENRKEVVGKEEGNSVEILLKERIKKLRMRKQELKRLLSNAKGVKWKNS